MKKLIVSLCILALVAVPVMATTPTHRIPAKSELTLGGQYLKPKSESAIWQANGEFLYHLGGNYLLVGPALNWGSDSSGHSAGAVAELNFGGADGGPFVGGAADYFLTDVSSEESYAGSARAGLKFPIGKSGLFKAYAQKVLTGRGKDDGDVGAAVALGVRF